MRVIYAPAYYFTGEPGSKLDYVSKRARHFENKLEIDVYRFLILMKAVFEMGRLRIFDGVSVNQSFRYRSLPLHLRQPRQTQKVAKGSRRLATRAIRVQYSKPQSSGVATYTR